VHKYFANYLKGCFKTKAHVLKFLLQLINIWRRNNEKMRVSFLKHSYFEFSDLTR